MLRWKVAYFCLDLIDGMELERTVTNLNKELSVSREAEGALRTQLEELVSLQSLPDEVNNLMKRVSSPSIFEHV